MKRKISVISSEKDNWKGEIEILTRNDKVAYVKTMSWWLLLLITIL